MPYDFSDVPDEILNNALANTWALPKDAAAAAAVERARRDTARREASVTSGAPAPPAPNVRQNLDAAATPIAVEPEAGPSKRDAYAARMEAAGYTPKEAGMAADYEGTMRGAYELPESDETLRRGAAYQRDQDRRMGRFDANLAESMGHNVGPGMSTEIMPNASSRPAWAENAFRGEMINVDGVMVMAYDLGDGKLRYSLGDVKRAKEAQMGARRDASWREMIDSENAQYGDNLPANQVSAPQLANRAARKEAEKRQAAKREERRQFQIANKDRPLTPSEQSRKERRDTYSYMAGLAGGSSGLRGGPGGNMGGLRALAMLRGVDRPDMTPEQRNLLYAAPGGRVAAAVDEKNNEQLAALGLRVAQGQGFQEMTPEQRAMLGLRVNEAERAQPAAERAMAYRDQPEIHPSEEQMVDEYVTELYSAPGSVWGLGGLSSSFTVAEQQQTVDWLVQERQYAPEKAQRLVDGIVRKRGGQSWWGNWDGT